MNISVIFIMGDYSIKPFSKERRNIELLLSETERKHVIHALITVDVTDARERIRKMKSRGKDISFTAWIIKCFAEVMKEYREFNALRHGKRKLVFFDDVDVALPVEKDIEDEKTTMAYILRQAGKKDIFELTEEIRKAQGERLSKEEQLIGKKGWMEKFAIVAPYFIKKLLLIIAGRNAFMRKKYMGTTVVTSVGMIGNFSGWLLTLGGHSTTQLGVGGIEKKVVMKDGKAEEREFLHLNISIDHDVVDGAPLARFASKLAELMENGTGLEI